MNKTVIIYPFSPPKQSPLETNILLGGVREVVVITLLLLQFPPVLYINEANGSFSIVLSHKPHLHAALNKRSYSTKPNCSNTYVEILPFFLRL